MAIQGTDPSTLPPDVCRKILLARDAIIMDDISEADHQLYAIACPDFCELKPWDKIEAVVKQDDCKRGEKSAIMGLYPGKEGR